MYNENNPLPQNGMMPEVSETPVAEKEKSINEVLYRAWFHKYFLKDFGKLEKRLLDWWTGEGFFGITNLVPTPDGKTLDFMLRVGRSAYDEMSNESEEYLNEKTEKVVNVKKRQGWDIYSCNDTPNLHVLYKTQKNVDKIQQLLMANIRSFKIEKFEYDTIEGVEYIKSLTIKIYKKQ
jgi:hypothetical protein